MEDALNRAKAYTAAGADGILIHSRQETPDEIFEFCKRYNKLKYTAPIFVVPTSYSHVREQELVKNGIRVVIYANHLIRSAYPAMTEVAESILKNKRAFEAERYCMSIDEVIRLIPNPE